MLFSIKQFKKLLHSSISLICENFTPRLKYVADFVFEQVLGVSYQAFPQHATGGSHRYPIYYGVYPSDLNAVVIPDSGLLNETGIDPKWLHAFREGGSAFKPSADKATVHGMASDLFALIFFCISRYEEYLPFEGDNLGRFRTVDSVLFQTGKIKTPLVDEAIGKLRASIEYTFKLRLPEPLSGYRYLPTIDVDQAFAFYNKGWRNIAGMISDLFNGRYATMRKRWKSTFNEFADPFQRFAELDFWHCDAEVPAIYFFLMAARRSKLDKNHSPNDKAYQVIMLFLCKTCMIGLHPSYRSFKNPALISSEKKALESIISREVTYSRQHYLMMHLPKTYRALLESGLQHDFSMGFFDDTGYRASTGHSFYWYDLPNDCVTELKVTPFQLMDVTLKKYLNLNAEEAKTAILESINIAKKYNSPLCSVWHNSSFSSELGWPDEWWDVYEYLIYTAGGHEERYPVDFSDELFG
jgi:hypothetical protein